MALKGKILLEAYQQSTGHHIYNLYSRAKMRQYAQNWEIDCQGMTSVYKNPYLTKIS